MPISFAQSAGLGSLNSSATRTLTTVNDGASLAIECMSAIGGAEGVAPTATGVTFSLAQSKTMTSTSMGTRWYVAHDVPAGTVITFTPSTLMKWAVDMWEVLGGNGTLGASDSVTSDTISVSSATPSPGLSVPDGAGVLAMFHCDRNPTATAPASFTLGAQVATDENPLYNLTYSRIYSGAASNQRGTLAAQGSAMYYNAALLVFPAATAAPTVSTQPTAQTVTAPAAATFTAVVTGTYTGLRWQRQAAGAGAWADISGATSTTLTTGATTVSGGSWNSTDRVRLQVDWSGGTVTSTDVALTVNAAGAAPAITVQPTNQSATVGGTATFSVTATGSGTLAYQWERSINGGSSWANVTTGSGGTTSTYVTAATSISGGNANNGDQYRCVVAGDTAPPATSSAATLTVQQPIATTFAFTISGGANLTGIKYAIHEETTPDQWVAPIKKGADETSDADGLCVVSVVGLTTRRVGELGSAFATNSDGTATGGAQAATRRNAYYVGAFS